MDGEAYQFAATMGLLFMLMCLDLGFWRTRWSEDLFFFFCKGRAMVVGSLRQIFGDNGLKSAVELKVQRSG